jgi:hypothetical protein
MDAEFPPTHGLKVGIDIRVEEEMVTEGYGNGV